MVDCEFIPELSYDEFGKKLADEAWYKRIPLGASIEVTYRCNNRCIHCFQEGGHQGLKGQRELSLHEWGGIFDQMVDLGTLWLMITGGEPLLRPDIMDIYDQARQRGMILTLFTNGTLITPQFADRLAEDKPFLVEISLYGYSQQTYERVTGVPGSHARCMRGIELLLERGIQLKLKTVLLQQNRHEIEEMKRFSESLGLHFRYDANIMGGIWNTESPKPMRVSPQDIVALDMQDEARRREWAAQFKKFNSVPSPELLQYRYRCGAGLQTYHIDPYGYMSMCLIDREPGYDVRQGSLADGWHNTLYQTRFQPAPAGYLHDDCTTCNLLGSCFQCPGWQQLEGLLDGQKPQFLCEIAHLRSQKLSNIP